MGMETARAIRYELRNEAERGVKVAVEVQRARDWRSAAVVGREGAARRREAMGVGQREANMVQERYCVRLGLAWTARAAIRG